MCISLCILSSSVFDILKETYFIFLWDISLPFIFMWLVWLSILHYQANIVSSINMVNRNIHDSPSGDFIYFLFFKLYCLHYCRCPHFPPFTTSIQPSHSLPSGHHHTVVFVYGLYTHVLWLIPSSFLSCSPVPSPLWWLSVCSMYPCFCFYFVHQIPHISKIL